jgi:F-type H+-transporting ATPase subunit delta
MSDNSARANQYAQAIVQAMLERWQSVLVQAADALSKDNKVDLDAPFLRDAPTELVNTLKLMQQQGDLELLPDVSAALGNVIAGRSAPIKAEITSAIALGDSEREQIQRSLTEQYGEGLLFSFRVDPALLGGLRVRVGDRLIDTSIASRLAALRESLATVVR